MNTIIFIGIALIIIVAIGVFFLDLYAGKSTDVQKLFSQGCSSLRSNQNCDHRGISKITVEGTNFGLVCGRIGYADTGACAKACGCDVPEGEVGEGLSVTP